MAIIIFAYFLLFFLVGLSRHWAYLTSLNDLGVFDQAVWATLHGDFMLNTSNPLGRPINWLGFHFNLIVLAFVPLYAIAPRPEWFTLAQAAAVALTAWPLFLLATRLFRSEKLGVVWAVVYLLNPFVLNAAAWDFHPVALAAPCIAWALLAIDRGQRGLLLGCCVTLMLVQEQLGVTVAGLGLLWGLRNGRWLFAMFVIVLGALHAALVLGIAMPALSPTGRHLMTGEGLGQLSRYSWLGNSSEQVIVNLLTRPVRILELVMVDLGGWHYVLRLLLPFLFMPLLSPTILLAGLADFAANFLSANAMPRSIIAYHSVTLAPVLTVAAMFGCIRLQSRFRRFSLAEVCGLMLVASVTMGYIFLPLPLPGATNYWQPTRYPLTEDVVLEKIRGLIGPDSRVVAQANVGAHFSQRRSIEMFSEATPNGESVILMLDSPTFRLEESRHDGLGTLSHHLQMPLEDYLKAVECVVTNPNFGVVMWEAPWLVLARGAPISSSQMSAVRIRISELRRNWRVVGGGQSCSY